MRTLEEPLTIVEAAPAPLPGRSRGIALIAAVRPQQWTKNLVVVLAPAAAGVLDRGSAVLHTAVIFVGFVLLSAGTYLLNDLADIERDRLHPLKRNRPVANGEIAPAAALAGGVLLLIAGLAVAGSLGYAPLIVALGYVVLTSAYTIILKRLVVIDLLAVASAYVMRAAAGAAAVDVPLSQSFLTVICFGALVLVAGKRHGERVALGERIGAATRPTLARYSPRALRLFCALASALAVGAYAIWSVRQPDHGQVPLAEVSLLPVALGALRYARLLRAGKGAAPEELIIRDHQLLALGLVWAALFAGSIYVAA